jgi:hypothetical protein
MGTYKVIQDIEAEDKFVGPLTLRQFIFAFIGAGIGYMCFLTLQRGLWIVTLVFLPLFIFCVFFAWPFGKDQPTEVWALAKIRFMFKPRRRIWDQSGMKDLVTITVPKKIEKHLTDGLTQTEVKSRLQALANTIDSRGWAVKNVAVNMFSEPSYAMAGASSDRLVDVSSLPQEVPTYEVLAADDMMDETSNPTAQLLDTMINQSTQTHRQAIMATVQNGQQPPAQQTSDDYWFMNQPAQSAPVQPGYATFARPTTVQPGTGAASAPVARAAADDGAEEQQLLEKIHHKRTNPNPVYSHMHTLQPSADPPADDAASPTTSSQPPQQTPQTTSGTEANPDILRLANNDDLNVATIAREANKATHQSDDGEVVISLH